MRIFIAVDPSAAAIAALATAQAALRAQVACRRWPDPAGAHLTLHFLGEASEAEAAAVDAALGRVAAAAPPFGLALAGLGAFPTPARPRVLWAGVAGGLPALHALHAALGEALRALGRPPEDRAFRPHLTLAREPVATEAAGRALRAVAIAAVAWEVTEVVLYRSHLEAGGARYEAIARHPLGG